MGGWILWNSLIIKKQLQDANELIKRMSAEWEQRTLKKTETNFKVHYLVLRVRLLLKWEHLWRWTNLEWLDTARLRRRTPDLHPRFEANSRRFQAMTTTRIFEDRGRLEFRRVPTDIRPFCWERRKVGRCYPWD